MTTPFNQLLNDAADLAKRGGSADALATCAVELARHIRDAQAALEPLKSLIRDLAYSERKSLDQHHVGYPVPNGRVSVTFPERRYEARKDIDIAAAREDLGAEFPVYFREVVTYRTQPDVKAILETQTHTEAAKVLKHLQLDEPIARVGFKTA